MNKREVFKNPDNGKHLKTKDATANFTSSTNYFSFVFSWLFNTWKVSKQKKKKKKFSWEFWKMDINLLLNDWQSTLLRLRSRVLKILWKWDVMKLLSHLDFLFFFLVNFFIFFSFIQILIYLRAVNPVNGSQAFLCAYLKIKWMVMLSEIYLKKKNSFSRN